MSNQILRIDSISELHRMLGLDGPRHPLISVVDAARVIIPPALVGVKLVGNFYYMALKDGSCGIEYGRNPYDFEEGVLLFTAPGQVITATREQKENEVQGWMLFFHPDLIRTSALGENIGRYSFFSYDVHEALHLSEAEAARVTYCVDQIVEEYSQRIDAHSQRVIVSNIELLLNYCLRFYERQFNVRTNLNKDVVSQFERILKAYFESGETTNGLPSIQYFADQLHLSQNYLSDVLKKESGRSAKDYINDYVVEKAKTVLLNSTDSVSGIAYTLGFNYPHYFSRLFKNKTGMTPQEYRDLN
ncbi:MAG: helix-turn-helix transcriptional regulator [Bacteroidetes bacterium]|nr:helix-turn-helix transcriptional regulator [Bacteroidota bacterium]